MPRTKSATADKTAAPAKKATKKKATKKVRSVHPDAKKKAAAKKAEPKTGTAKKQTVKPEKAGKVVLGEGLSDEVKLATLACIKEAGKQVGKRFIKKQTGNDRLGLPWLIQEGYVESHKEEGVIALTYTVTTKGTRFLNKLKKSVG